MGIEIIWAQGGASESIPRWDDCGAGKKSPFNWSPELTGVEPSWLSGHIAGDSQTIGASKTV